VLLAAPFVLLLGAYVLIWVSTLFARLSPPV